MLGRSVQRVPRCYGDELWVDVISPVGFLNSELSPRVKDWSGWSSEVLIKVYRLLGAA